MKDLSKIQVYQTAVKRNFGRTIFIRMALHPMGVVDGLSNGSTKPQQYPFRVVYRHGGKRGKPWYYSCLGTDVRFSNEQIIYGGIVGDGSDAAALLWLLEGE